MILLSRWNNVNGADMICLCFPHHSRMEVLYIPLGQSIISLLKKRKKNNSHFIFYHFIITIGMENPCLTFVTPTLLAGDRSLTNVVAHEIAHR